MISLANHPAIEAHEQREAELSAGLGALHRARPQHDLDQAREALAAAEREQERIVVDVAVGGTLSDWTEAEARITQARSGFEALQKRDSILRVEIDVIQAELGQLRTEKPDLLE